MEKRRCTLEKHESEGLHLVLGEMKAFCEAKNMIHYCKTTCKDLHSCLKKTDLVRHLDKNVKEE